VSRMAGQGRSWAFTRRKRRRRLGIDMHVSEGFKGM
jgi:hypothetical protein